MIKNDTLKKSFLNKKELNDFYNSQFEPMKFLWLNEVKTWIEKTYNVKVMTILYDFIDNMHNFTVYLYSYDQYKNIPLVGNNFWTYHSEEIEIFISRYLILKDDEKIECKLSTITFTAHAKRYLLCLSYRILDKQITELFAYLNPVYISVGQVMICVLETKEEAKKLLLDNNYTWIRQQIFDLLKPYDDYNVLEVDDIRIFVDYKENKEKTPMYVRWVQEMRNEDLEAYERTLINL